MSLVNQASLLKERKHQLEQDLNKMLVDFQVDTGIWVDHIKIYKEVTTLFEMEEARVLDHAVKIHLDI